MFSSRLPAALEPNALAAAIDRRRASGTPFIDLTVTNPTAVGIPYPAALLQGLASPEALRYTPAPLGLRAAREAVARDYARRGIDVSPDRIVLTASTSEAYSLLFKLLCDASPDRAGHAGSPVADEILIPQPSYPLFDLLSRLDGVRAVPYRLQPHADWSIDRDSVERALSDRTRAVLVVSPNNPTGSVLTDDDADWLATLCAAREIAIIADEVFADYPLGPSRSATVPSCPAFWPAGSASGHAGPSALCFSLGGLSKSVGLPQVKLGWMAVNGPDALVKRALERLDVICDTYLSVATPVQTAAASLIEGGAVVRQAIRHRLHENLATLGRLVSEHADVTLVEPRAGWTAVIQVPATEPEEQLVLRLLDEQNVLVHPGYFFDFAREAFLVMSLLPEPSQFADGAARVLAR
jgi:aspartate/methionine/tyrosine aminotransferase